MYLFIYFLLNIHPKVYFITSFFSPLHSYSCYSSFLFKLTLTLFRIHLCFSFWCFVVQERPVLGTPCRAFCPFQRSLSIWRVISLFVHFWRRTILFICFFCERYKDISCRFKRPQISIRQSQQVSWHRKPDTQCHTDCRLC